MIDESKNDIISKLDPIQHLKDLNFPRMAGSDGDKLAVEYILSTLNKNNIFTEKQDIYFKEKGFTLFSFLIPSLFCIWGIILISNIFLFSFDFYLSFLILLFPITVLLIFINLNSVMTFFMKKNYKKFTKLEKDIINSDIKEKDQKFVKKSTNIIATLGLENAKHNIIFTAHFDSISSKIPMKLTKYFGIIGLLGFLFIAISYFLNILLIEFTEWNLVEEFSTIYLAIIVVDLIILNFLLFSRIFKTNESHGVIDDGTGVAILLELAKYIKENNIENLKDHKFIFGFFGAEELGLIGSVYYYNKFGKNFDKDNTHIISVDMIGETEPISYVKAINPFRKAHMDKEFNDNLEKVAEEMNIMTKGINFFYPGSDFAHWLFNGYKTNWFINESKFIHSKKDNLSNINEKLIKDTLKLLIGILNKI